MRHAKKTEEIVATLPLGVLDVLMCAVDGVSQDGHHVGSAADGASASKGEPLMCYKTSNAEDYVIIKIVHELPLEA